MDLGGQSETPFHTNVPRFIDHESASAPGSNVSNYNPSMNTHQGTGNILNYNPNINYIVYENMAQHSHDAIQGKIAAALRERHVPQAVYSAQLGSGCMDGTRVQVLRDIETWIQNPEAPQIFWLTGIMGSGKTAIGWTVCSRARASSKMVLGGSFFCSRSAGTGAQRDARCIIPTLVQLLARQSFEFSQILVAELARDPDILHQRVAMQMEYLLYKPLLVLQRSSLPIVFVIDALDECGGLSNANGPSDDSESHRLISDMLEALVAFSRYPVKLPVKFLVISRPETHIRDTPVSDPKFSRVLQLHTVNKQHVMEDIRLYISTRLRSGPKLNFLFTNGDVDTLVQLCNGLFIVATTALEFALGAGVDRAVVRFKRLLNSTQDGLSAGAAAPLDRMYALILAEAVNVDTADADLGLPNLLQMLASLLCARSSLSVAALSELIDLPVTHLRACLSHLHAVLHVPDDDGESGLRTLHASFSDYMFGRAPTSSRVTASLGHNILARGCLNVMVKRLHFNVSKSLSSYDQNPSTTPNSITPSLEYACLHWVYHIYDLPRNLVHAFEGDINAAFVPRFLFWLEVLSVLGRVSRGAAMLIIAASTFKEPALSRFLHDGQTFVASSREAIGRSAPHIYISALPFAPTSSLIYQTFAPLCTGLIAVESFGIGPHGGRLLMTLAGHEGAVLCVSYSPDGRLLASGSEDGSVRIWDMRLGEETMAPLCSGDGPIRSVAFAPDGRSIASGTGKGVICVWGTLAGQTTPQRLWGHSDTVNCVVFAPDGSTLASASMDKTVRLWRAETGQHLAIHSDHEGEVTSVAFSPDGMILASGSNSGFGSEHRAIRLRHGNTGEPKSQLQLDLAWVPIFGVCFSPDGTRIALGCGDDVRLYETQTGRFITSLQNRPDPVRSVQFSPDGQSMLVVANSGDLQLLTLERTGHKASSIIVTKDVLHATFSPDGSFIASSSAKGFIRVWSVNSSSTGAQQLPAYDAPLSSIAITPDCAVLVSGSMNGSICVWNTRNGKQNMSVRPSHTAGSVLWVGISPDGNMVASVTLEDHRRSDRKYVLLLWNVPTGERLVQLSLDSADEVVSMAFSTKPSRRWHTNSENRTLLIWDVVTRQMLTCHILSSDKGLMIALIAPDNRPIGMSDCVLIFGPGYGRQREHAPLVHAPALALALPFTMCMPAYDWAAHVWDIHRRQSTYVEHPVDAGIFTISPADHTVHLDKGGRDETNHLRVAAVNAYSYFRPHITLRIDARDGESCWKELNRDYLAEYTDEKICVRGMRVDCLWYSGIGNVHITALASAKLKNGWLTGRSGELLLWVPEEYREQLQKPPCTMIIGQGRVSIAVGASGWFRGMSWTACWQDEAPSCAIP